MLCFVKRIGVYSINATINPGGFPVLPSKAHMSRPRIIHPPSEPGELCRDLGLNPDSNQLWVMGKPFNFFCAQLPLLEVEGAEENGAQSPAQV